MQIDNVKTQFKTIEIIMFTITLLTYNIGTSLMPV